MSEENKNRSKDKGNQKNIARKYDTSPKQDHNTEMAEESEFVNIQGKKNKRKRKQEKEVSQYRCLNRFTSYLLFCLLFIGAKQTSVNPEYYSFSKGGKAHVIIP